MSKTIEHTGVIESINGNQIRVKIVQSSACSSCQVKSMCSSSESKEKLIDIESSLSDHYNVGEEVVVCGSLSMSRNAVLLAFAIPLILIVVWVVCGTYFLSLNEQMIMVGILIILAVYYLVLHFLNDKMSKSFSFWIKRPSS